MFDFGRTIYCGCDKLLIFIDNNRIKQNTEFPVRFLIGALLNIANWTRHDIAGPVNILSQYMPKQSATVFKIWITDSQICQTVRLGVHLF